MRELSDREFSLVSGGGQGDSGSRGLGACRDGAINGLALVPPWVVPSAPPRARAALLSED